MMSTPPFGEADGVALGDPIGSCRWFSHLGLKRLRVDSAAQLARVVRNLADNAERHATDVVALSVAERNGHVTLAVADDGPGIPVADRIRVFERFTRLDDARARRTGGYGLGLAIVRDVVAAHGGTVVIDEGAGGGARVIVELPAATPT